MRFPALYIAFRIWLVAAALLSVCIIFSILAEGPSISIVFIAPIIISIAALPAFLFLWVILPIVSRSSNYLSAKFKTLTAYLLPVALGYGFLLGELINFFSFVHVENLDLLRFVIGFLCMAIIIFIAVYSSIKPLRQYFQTHHISSLNTSIMSTTNEPSAPLKPNTDNYLVKGAITAGLMLAMLLPMVIISNLVQEREQRQKEVVKEVSSKWALEQTVAGPFITIPYQEQIINEKGSKVWTTQQVILVPGEASTQASIDTEERKRSIFKVLLYKSDIKANGRFTADFPSGIDVAAMDWSKARICLSVSDYKGLQEPPQIQFNGQQISLNPGLPVDNFGSSGLSAPIPLSIEMLKQGIAFSTLIKLNGSSRLHFIPLASAASFAMNSGWHSPSFDGDRLPANHAITPKGFTASWQFNKANLPFSLATRSSDFNAEKLGFGVSFVQPASHYDKTMRSVKYAVLIIGLTFALFFMLEVLQKRPVHPVQYVLVGVALLVFYTLLLSISEYLPFDQAYAIASLATVMLISFYAKAHFKKWSTAGIFFLIISMLYVFVFVLIRLEDTALLIGSIGLFIIVALIMYASRQVNWYGNRSLSEPQAV